eukprot:TRINITY_DN1433_c0_g1_i1.p1 TRINITY_DN1433_c0_g1~~TRINITY_DN1433_c0_g1_i1.p1  ORF type:complete len:521 (+),score=130.91 TRINITY_DN1433_c0_g1_i1:98-1660(+)
MIPHSWWSFALVQILIGGFRCIFPLNSLYLVLFVCSNVFQSFRIEFIENFGRFGLFLAFWSLLEVVFYFYQLNRIKMMQNPPLHPCKSSESERRNIFMRCFRSFHGNPREFWEGWFLGSKMEEIQLENAKEWILWAIFDMEYKNFDRHPQFDVLNAELNGYIKFVEKTLQRPFQIGYNRNVKSMRLTLDPVVFSHRPLIVYLGIGLFDTHIHWILNGMKFTHYDSDVRLGYRPYFPPSYRKASDPKHQFSFSFWHRPARNPSLGLKPIVFFHGIGAGLHSYALLLKELERNNPDSDIFLVELMHVSMRFVNKIPHKDEIVNGVERMLLSFGHSNAVICGHSMGTAVSAWIVKDKPHLVSDLILIDPICLMLHLPHVAYNFVYRIPRKANEWLIWWFACRESGIAWALGRSFYWTQNILWKDQIPLLDRTTIILAERDAIVPSNEVFSYLTEFKGKEPESRKERESMTIVSEEKGLKIMWAWDIDHAVCIFKHKKDIVKVITEAANGHESPISSPETFSKN